MLTILILVLVLVVLIVIDLYRKSLRVKQKELLKHTENYSSGESLEHDKSSSPTNIEEVREEYPLMREGYLLLYYEAFDGIDVKDLSRFLKYYNIKYTDEKVFQKVNYDDVIFSVLPDNEKQVFESQKEGSVGALVIVMNFKKLASLEYNVKTCYELMIDMLEVMNKSFNGIIMNENRIRLTKRDKQNYLNAIT